MSEDVLIEVENINISYVPAIALMLSSVSTKLKFIDIKKSINAYVI
jgi:hypothetical protein